MHPDISIKARALLHCFGEIAKPTSTNSHPCNKEKTTSQHIFRLTYCLVEALDLRLSFSLEKET